MCYLFDDMNRTERLFLEAMFLVVLLTFTIAFYRIMEPFLLDIFLALVLANIFRRPYRRLARATGRPRLASALTIILVFFVIAVPVSTVVTLVSAELARAMTNVRGNWASIQSSILIPDVVSAARELPVIGNVVDQFAGDDFGARLRDILATSGDYVMRLFQRSIGNITGAVFNFLIVLLLLFFFLVDGKKAVDRIYETIPLSNRDIDQITAETFSTTSATLISTIIIGLLEGGLATVLFIAFGLPSPFFWGVITMVLSMIPLIGSNLIIIPAGLATIIGSRPIAGGLVALIGIIGVAITQNIIKPKLLGDRTGLHPALALLATIGGIAWLGLIGFLVGPVLAALFIVVWRQFAKRYKNLLEGKNDSGDAISEEPVRIAAANGAASEGSAGSEGGAGSGV